MQHSFTTLAILLITAICNADTISWTAPEATPAGSAPAITGYEVWKRQGREWQLDQSVSSATTTATVSPGVGNLEGEFAVRALWSGGRTALSDPVFTNDWLQNLPTPDGSNTVNNTMSRAAIQAVLNAAQPGDVIYFDGGEYLHTTDDSMLQLGGSTGAVDGQPGKHITIMPIPGETATFRGNPSLTNDHRCFSFTGDYWRIYGMTITEMGEEAIRGYSKGGRIEENTIYNGWRTGITMGGGPTMTVCEDMEARYNKCSYHQIQNGLSWGNDYGATTRNFRFIRNVSFKNGFDIATNRLNEFGGGNSDGIAGAKGFMLAVTENENGFDAWDFPEGTAVTGSVFHQNINFMNADDAMDLLPGHGASIVGNLAWGNTPSGQSAVKIVLDSYGKGTYIGNTCIGTTNYPYDSDTLYLASMDPPIEVGDVVLGASSGATGTVTDVVTFTGGAGCPPWGIYLSGESGSFFDNETITVGGVPHGVAEVNGQLGLNLRPYGMTLWYENGSGSFPAGQVVTGSVSGATATINGATLKKGDPLLGTAEGIVRIGGTMTNQFRAEDSLIVGGVTVADIHEENGRIGFEPGENFVANSTMYGAAAISNTYDPFTHGASGATRGNIVQGENINYTYGQTSSDNFLGEDEAGSPDLHNPAYDPRLPVLTGTTVQEQWRNLYREHMEQIMPTPGGNMHDAMVFEPMFHHATPADHPTKPSDPADLTKLHWYGSAPDIGASQFTEYWPPVVTVTDGGNGLAAGTATAATATATNLSTP
jgi:hypothetical protein